MTPNSLTRSTLMIATAALALGLAACGKTDDATTSPSSDQAIAKIAPPAGKSWSETVVQTADGGYLAGNPNAPIKLLEYGSLSCPHCALLGAEADEPLMNDYIASGRVSWEFRSFAIHPQDVPLTVLAECGGKETFFPLVAQVYKNFDSMNEVLNDKAALERAQASGNLPPNKRFVALANALGYVDFFAKRGLPVDQANACLADANKAQKVADLATKYGNEGINSTPTLFINGSKVELSGGEEPWPQLEAALQRAGAR